MWSGICHWAFSFAAVDNQPGKTSKNVTARAGRFIRTTILRLAWALLDVWYCSIRGKAMVCRNSRPSRFQTWYSLGAFFGWFFFKLMFIHLKHSGLMSLAKTVHPNMEAGTTKGPTPAQTSKTRSCGRRRSIMRSCSVPGRIEDAHAINYSEHLLNRGFQ